MTATRQAIMYVDRRLLLGLLPQGKGPEDLQGIADDSGQRFAYLARALHLPGDARITGVSTALRFTCDQVALRVASPDFVETPPGCELPEVDAMYRAKYQPDRPPISVLEFRDTVFDGWSGPAVQTDLRAASIGFDPGAPGGDRTARTVEGAVTVDELRQHYNLPSHPDRLRGGSLVRVSLPIGNGREVEVSAVSLDPAGFFSPEASADTPEIVEGMS